MSEPSISRESRSRARIKWGIGRCSRRWWRRAWLRGRHQRGPPLLVRHARTQTTATAARLASAAGAAHSRSRITRRVMRGAGMTSARAALTLRPQRLGSVNNARRGLTSWIALRRSRRMGLWYPSQHTTVIQRCATSRAVLMSILILWTRDLIAEPKSRQGRVVSGSTPTTMWKRTRSACRDCVAAPIVVAKLPQMLVARIHVITPELAVIKLLWARRARTQTTASTARLALVAGAAHSRSRITRRVMGTGMTSA